MTEVSAQRIPLIEERLNVDKRVVETGRVRIRTIVDESQVWIREDLEREAVDVVRVPIDRQIDKVPEVRVENDVIIVPVVEEQMVVEKRLFLIEELHIRRRRTTERVEQPVMLRRTRAEVERLDGDPAARPNTGAKP